MDITLTPGQEVFVRQAIKQGRLSCPEDAVAEALLLWEERETARAAFRASLDEASAALDRGEGLVITTPEAMEAAARETKQRLRARLAAEAQAAR